MRQAPSVPTARQANTTGTTQPGQRPSMRLKSAVGADKRDSSTHGSSESREPTNMTLRPQPQVLTDSYRQNQQITPGSTTLNQLQGQSSSRRTSYLEKACVACCSWSVSPLSYSGDGLVHRPRLSRPQRKGRVARSMPHPKGIMYGWAKLSLPEAERTLLTPLSSDI